MVMNSLERDGVKTTREICLSNPHQPRIAYSFRSYLTDAKQAFEAFGGRV